MIIARTVAELRLAMDGWRAVGDRVALVPTMGMLHRGHLSLVEAARVHAGRIVVSLFVNPTQFGPNEDFSRYPRAEAADAQALGELGVDLMYAPSVTEMYPAGFATTVAVSGLDRRWEGEMRPGHFAGVATIVTKLLTQALPDCALFGEKDYQQLQVVRRLVRDLDLPVTVLDCPTVRDEYGLALSSRNAYLDPSQVAVARRLNRVMKSVVDRLGAGAEIDGILVTARQDLLKAGFEGIDYFVVCDPETLEPMSVVERPGRLLAAVRLGGVRLLDNMPVDA